MEEEEPVTPVGRYFLQQEMNQVINCVVGLKHPIDMEACKLETKNSIFIQHPRFRSVLVVDNKGKQKWRITDIDLDRHILIQDIDEDSEDENQNINVVNRYLADLAVSSPLDTDKPLWEVHLLRNQKCAVLRIHHALGDGISLMSLVLALCRKVDHPDQLPTIPSSSPSSSSSSSTDQNHKTITSIWELVLNWVMVAWFSLVYAMELIHQNHKTITSIWELVLKWVMVAWFSLVYATELILRALWVKDSKTVISGGSGVELWPRKLVTARFRLEDMKLVKKAIANATINDVLFGVISSGISRYLDRQSKSKPPEGLRITGLAMVNIRKQPGLQDLSNLMKNKSVSSWWGNQFGFVLLPIYYHKDVGDDPLQYVKRAKAMVDRKKLSLEAHFSYRMGALIMSLLGVKIATLLNYRIFCNTSFTVSNVIGPQEEIMFAGNPITSFRAHSSSLSHALTMNMVSYAGKAEMEVLVAKDIIPDPQFLAKCFEDALLEMKDAAAAATSN